VTGDYAILTNKSSVRSDAGPYKVTLQNRYGKDTVKLNVNVLDKPGKPTGPIDATDVCADAMTLHWLPPKDNGGDEVTNYGISTLITYILFSYTAN
jgi:titin